MMNMLIPKDGFKKIMRRVPHRRMITSNAVFNSQPFITE